MAEWTVPVTYNYTPPYHAYAYSLMYQTVQTAPEQNQQTPTAWAEAAFTSGVTEAYYAAATGTQDESPPESPEQIAVNNHGHFQGSGVVYFGDTQAGRLFHYPNRTPYDVRAKETERARSGTPTSDSEAHTSPDSWSSSSSREGSLPQADPVTWARTHLDESPNRSKHVSSSINEEPETTLCLVESKNSTMSNPKPMPLLTKKKTAVPKAKTRTAFSESQMKTLIQRFSVQRYLTQGEMKGLAEVTGLSYKQVKTWFQNRRMKLRRHQKDTSWVSERYTVNKNDPNLNTTIYTNIPSHMQAYQGEAQSQLQERYSQQMREAVSLQNTTPGQNLGYYLAAMGGATGAPGYPPRPSTASSQPAALGPQAVNWPMPPPVTHYEYNLNTFSKASASVAGGDAGMNDSDTSLDDDEGNPVRIPSPLCMVMGHNASR